MYYTLLLAHSWVRWAVVLLGLFAVLRAIAGWSRGAPWTRADERAGLFLTIAIDLQFLLGLLLYFVYSQFTQLALNDFGAAMGASELRFWAVEHPFGAIVGLALIHIGRARLKKTPETSRRHRVAAIWFGIAMIAILVSIPWPGTPHARPLFHR